MLLYGLLPTDDFSAEEKQQLGLEFQYTRQLWIVILAINGS